jgi:DNA-binding MarR family transcriptional regulator
MTMEAATDSLVATLEDLAVLVRRLPATPELSLNTASALRACVVEGPQRISSLVERLHVSQPAVTQLVDRMAGLGWVERVADPADGRVVLVRATRLGRDVLERRRAGRAVLLDELIGRLDDADQRQLRAAGPALHRLTRISS